MATYTTRNDLIKPEYTDAADIHDLNDNFDFIDGSIAPCEWAKTTAPTVNDDVTLGYIVGSLWFDTTNHKLYICEDNTDTAAVWRQLYPQGSSAYASSSDPTVNDDSGDGFVVGSLWVNTTGHKVFLAESVAVGAAVWRQLYPAVMDLTGAVLTDGSKALTADWDAGSYHIQALHFVSDVATGTAPYQCTSTTVNTNLNADTVDGKDETAFALLAGRSGGQTIYGGTAKDETLILEANSADATGAIKLPHGGLEIGTKATTATYGAINIHEGASGAANAITFLDGDGSTAKASISKDSSDNLLLSAGGTSAYVAGSNGRFVFQAGMSGDLTFADTAFSSNFSMTQRPQPANNISTTYYGVYDAIFPEVDSGKTVTGSYKAYYTETMRNHNGASTDDDGTIDNLYGLQAIVGHYSSNTSMKGTTTNVYACSLGNYGQKGTITNMYGLYIADSARGGTITNEWSIYDASTALAYFTGTVSAGTIVDRTPGYDGDGLAELKKVKNDSKGHLDHETLPPFARCKVKKEGGIEEEGRDLGAMISILTKAVQQLSSQLDAAYAKHDDAEKRIAKLEARLAARGL